MKKKYFDCLAVITARAGSKRIPGKNIKMFCGNPLISYSIKAAIKSKIFDEIMVSTEDNTIAGIAKKCGASVPFLRSKKNANDYSTTADVLEEVLLKYKEIGFQVKYVCCIYPTAPFITDNLLINSFKKFIADNSYSLIPIVKYSHPIQRALKIKKEKIIIIDKENFLKRTQDLEPTFHDAGQFYWINVSKFLKTKKIITTDSTFFELQETNTQDIDTQTDFNIAELKYKLMKTKRIK